MTRTKRIFARMTVLVLALAMLFAVTACGKEKTVTAPKSEVLSKAVTAMTDAGNVTVSISGDKYDATQNKSVTVNEKIMLKKTADGYDYAVEETADGETKLTGLKIGNVAYMPLDPSGYDTRYVTPSKASSALPEALDTAKNFLENKVEGNVTSANGSFTLEETVSYKEDIEAFIAFVVSGKGKQAGEYIASQMGEDYTREMLVEDINATFDDDVTLLAMIRGIDGLLGKAGSELTVKKIVNGICASAEITPATLKQLIPSLINPKEGETVYDYLLANGLGVVKADTVLAIAGSQFGVEITTAQIRETILSVIDNDQMTFDMLYDNMIAPFLDTVAAAALSGSTKDADWIMGEMAKGTFLCTDNLTKISVEEADSSVKATVDAKTYTVKNARLSEKIFITYTDDIAGVKHLLRTDSVYELSFDYSSVTLSAPEGKVNPCILMNGKEAVKALPTTGGMVINVYEGNDYTFKSLRVYESVLGSEPIEGVTYNGGRVIFEAKAISAIRESLDNGMYVTLKLTFEDSDKVTYDTYLIFFPQDE